METWGYEEQTVCLLTKHPHISGSAQIKPMFSSINCTVESERGVIYREQPHKVCLVKVLSVPLSLDVPANVCSLDIDSFHRPVNCLFPFEIPDPYLPLLSPGWYMPYFALLSLEFFMLIWIPHMYMYIKLDFLLLICLMSFFIIPPAISIKTGRGNFPFSHNTKIKGFKTFLFLHELASVNVSRSTEVCPMPLIPNKMTTLK